MTGHLRTTGHSGSATGPTIGAAGPRGMALPPQGWYVVTAAVAVVVIAWPIRHVLSPEFGAFLWARDFELYRDAAARWLGGGPYYLPEQLGGPYALAHGHVLYPPPSVLLFAPFGVLPAILWWAIPIAVTLGVVVHLRPRPWAWPLMLLALGWPVTIVKILTGNPVMWAVAAVALGRVFPWGSVLALLKPSLFPFALLGIRSRSWWIALAVLGGASLLLVPVLPSWLDFIQAVRFARDPFGLLYSVLEVPMVSIPLVAWLARRRAPAPRRPAEGQVG